MQKNYQKAFSLIELIFVILITGILAAVAIPKLSGMGKSAHLATLKSFTGSLNRSVGPALWLGVINNEPSSKGSVKNSTNYASIVVGEDVEDIPTTFTGLGDPETISLSTCMPFNTALPSIDAPIGGLTSGKIAETVRIGNTTYALGCIDSNPIQSPKFYLYDEVAGVMVY